MIYLAHKAWGFQKSILLKSKRGRSLHCWAALHPVHSIGWREDASSEPKIARGGLRFGKENTRRYLLSNMWTEGR